MLLAKVDGKLYFIIIPRDGLDTTTRTNFIRTLSNTLSKELPELHEFYWTAVTDNNKSIQPLFKLVIYGAQREFSDVSTFEILEIQRAFKNKEMGLIGSNNGYHDFLASMSNGQFKL